MLSVHSSLHNPTRARYSLVIHLAIGACTLLFLAFGVSGYLYSYGETRDNILLNFDPSDRVVLLGRLGLGITLIAGVPMIVLPCRDALLILPAQINRWRFERMAVDGSETVPVLAAGGGGSNGGGDDDDRLVVPDPPFVVHAGATVFIAGSCFMAASFFPGVSTVWSICGSR